MKRLKRTPEELKMESLRFHASREKRKQEGLKAVAEMSKHPLSLEQARAQIREHQAEVDRLEKEFARKEQRKGKRKT